MADDLAAFKQIDDPREAERNQVSVRIELAHRSSSHWLGKPLQLFVAVRQVDLTEGASADERHRHLAFTVPVDRGTGAFPC